MSPDQVIAFLCEETRAVFDSSTDIEFNPGKTAIRQTVTDVRVVASVDSTSLCYDQCHLLESIKGTIVNVNNSQHLFEGTKEGIHWQLVLCSNPAKLNVGDESVAYGDVAGNIGNRSVVIGPTDNQGNTIINQPMAVGYGAKAGPDGIAIGAYAGAGNLPADVANAFSSIAAAVQDNGLSEEQSSEVLQSVTELVRQANIPENERSRDTVDTHLGRVNTMSAIAATWIGIIKGFFAET